MKRHRWIEQFMLTVNASCSVCRVLRGSFSVVLMISLLRFIHTQDRKLCLPSLRTDALLNVHMWSRWSSKLGLLSRPARIYIFIAAVCRWQLGLQARVLWTEANSILPFLRLLREGTDRNLSCKPDVLTGIKRITAWEADIKRPDCQRKSIRMPN